MKHITALILLAASCALSRADLTVTYEIEAPGQPETPLTMRIKEGKIRSDVSPEVSAIVDARTGDTISLMHGQKMAMALPGAMIKAAAAEASQKAAGMGGGTPKATGRTETITGFSCEEYVVESGDQRFEIWTTRDVPDSEELLAQLTAMGREAGPSSLLPDAKLEGFPIRTIIASGTGAGTKITVVALSRDELSAEDFEIPKGYRKVEMPKVP